MTLRDDVRERITELTQSSGPTVFAFDNPSDTTEDIIDMWRKALTSDAAVDALLGEFFPSKQGAREAITAALDAVLGEQP